MFLFIGWSQVLQSAFSLAHCLFAKVTHSLSRSHFVSLALSRAMPLVRLNRRCDTISRLSRIDCVHQEIDRSFGFDVCKSHVVYICNFLHSVPSSFSFSMLASHQMRTHSRWLVCHGTQSQNKQTHIIEINLHEIVLYFTRIYFVASTRKRPSRLSNANATTIVIMVIGGILCGASRFPMRAAHTHTHSAKHRIDKIG